MTVYSTADIKLSRKIFVRTTNSV